MSTEPMMATRSATRKPFAQHRQDLQVVKRRRAEVDAVRLGAAIAFQVDAQLTARGFNRRINGALRRVEAFRPQLEVVDQALPCWCQFRSAAAGQIYELFERTGPSGSLSMACWMMRTDWRISSMRTM